MVKIEHVGGERPKTIDLGGIIMETGYFRSHYVVTVEKGDTFESVALQLGTTPQSLYAQNKEALGDDLEKVTLEPGKQLEYKTPASRGIELTI